MQPWRVVTDYDRRGNTMAEYLICPECWPTNTSVEGRTPYGRTSVSTISKTLRTDDTCYHCQSHPVLPEATV